MSQITATQSQRKRLSTQAVGVGFIVWKSAENVTTEIEFFIKDGQLFNKASGKPLSFEYGKMGLMKSLSL